MPKSAPKPVIKAAKDYEAWYEQQIRLGLDDLDADHMVTSEMAEKHFEETLKQLDRRQYSKDLKAFLDGHCDDPVTSRLNEVYGKSEDASLLDPDLASMQRRSISRDN